MPSETDPTEQLEGECLDGRFDLVALVARGGHGVVYRGVHRALRCPIAVKLLVCDADSDFARARFVEQFENEARTVAALRHPAIVRVLDHGIASRAGSSLPYLVLEWVDGETLDDSLRVDPRGRSPKQALALVRPVFEAIATAHEAGVVHRDIKPANLMLTRDSKGEPSLRVLDFGIAKRMKPEELLATGSSVTTDDFSSFSLSHAAPEQVARMRTGPWTDVHSLALLLVEVLVGQRAYQAENNVELFARITAPKRPTPAIFGVRVGPWEATLDKAMSLAVAERHSDAGALLRALEESVESAQRSWDTARDSAIDGSARRPVRRRSGRAAIAALASVLALASVALGVRLMHSARSPTTTPAIAPAPSPRVEPASPANHAPARPPPVEPQPSIAASQPATAPTQGAAPLRRTPVRSATPRARSGGGRGSLIEDEIAIQ